MIDKQKLIERIEFLRGQPQDYKTDAMVIAYLGARLAYDKILEEIMKGEFDGGTK